MVRERAPSDASLLLPSEAVSLRSIPIYPIFVILRNRIIREFYTNFSLQQLRAPDVQNSSIRPLFLFISERAQKAGVYICLLNFWEFTRESEQQIGQAEIYKTRASVCELLAIDLLQNYSGCTMNIIQVLTFQFSPDQGSEAENDARDDPLDPLDLLDLLDLYPANGFDRKKQKNLHTSALGIASRSGAKFFTASALVQAAIQWIWSGDVVFYGKQIDSDTYYSRIESTPESPVSPGDLEIGIELHSFLPNRFGGMFRASRLRVPVYQNCINVFFYLILLALYSYVLSNRANEFT
ncbi:hypothetical protein DSO57_1032490 [Entomophthora muscae]|uniref:Uncharacterized protein n=1 Tax=Entomophthora muscae TaxID=34485 RepID=A0ACC2UA74_9FUNG|nr:hypothetical protein DSO57_1032490 [Entomophthora muscae]